MNEFLISSVSWNEKRTEVYLYSVEQNSYFILDFIKNEVRINKKGIVRKARISELNSINNDFNNFFASLFRSNVNEFWLIAYFDMMNTVKNYTNRSSWASHRYEKMRRMFGTHDEYVFPDSVFTKYSPIIEKLAKQGVVLKDYASIHACLNKTDGSIFNFNLTKYRKNPFELVCNKSQRDYCQKVSVEKYVQDLLVFKKNPVLESLYSAFVSYGFKEEEEVLRKSIITNQHRYTPLLNKFKYEPKRLVKYLFEDMRWQGLIYTINNNYYQDDHLRLLEDYASMSYDIYGSTHFDKYPKYLKTQHDIVQMNFRVKEDEIKTSKFKAVSSKYDDWKDFTVASSKYCIQVPEKPHDLVMEGANLNHCVSSYIDNVLNEECMILFIREKEKKDESYLTVEVANNKIVQVRGVNNRTPTLPEELSFIDAFSKKYSLKNLEESA